MDNFEKLPDPVNHNIKKQLNNPLYTPGKRGRKPKSLILAY